MDIFFVFNVFDYNNQIGKYHFKLSLDKFQERFKGNCIYYNILHHSRREQFTGPTKSLTAVDDSPDSKANDANIKI